KTSGYRVSPTEIEEAAFASGLVAAAAAIGLDDDRLGQRIALFVTAKGEALDADALLAAMRKALPLYMVPHHVLVRSELPTSPNGKIDRNRLRSELDR
ncbi:MAG TPA: acyl-CoA ligase (AMP-forming), exosortase A system-associated, partial [Acidimicrobiia bacterium]|nr:acyl-CoA ligase (AMP-forming), exosortase A system-associated [Acidimicrobiia bacterium]